MTCRAVADFILEYLTGELSETARAVFEQHLALCPNCREYLALYEASIEMGRHAFDADEEAATQAGVPEELVAAILNARSH